MDITAVTATLALLKSALGLAKDANELVADSPKRRAAEIALTQAEQQLRLAEVKAAEELRYQLCDCTFPPQIALRKPDGSRPCPACGRDTNEDYQVRPGGGW